ncbi:MAG: Rrf2 family transcriptional regulator [Treponema sp. CETP13]|nr:MAG: Rrf2 family transcriptional regulator [Treponema sp. CETP13]
MMISTKGRYAMRVVIDLAQNKDEGFISLKNIAERQKISLKYLEIIISNLNKAGFVESKRGNDGGYRLVRAASDYSVSEILNSVEKSLSPVKCVDKNETACKNESECLTHPLWQKLDTVIDQYLKSVTLEDILLRKL